MKLYENGLPVVVAKDGPRIDSRVVADLLGIENRALLQNIDARLDKFKGFGVVTFQMQKPPKGSKGGMPVRYALLTEDQAYFAATLSRNTERAVEVKFQLVLAFREARKAQEIKHGQYLPFHHLAHGATQQMAIHAANSGSETPERIFHVNIEKMVNAAFGIQPGQRDQLSAAQRNAISAAYQIISAAIADTLANGGDHHLAYQEAKHRVSEFIRLFGPVAGRLAA